MTTICKFAGLAIAALSFGAGLNAQLLSRAPRNRHSSATAAVEYLFPEQVTLPADKTSLVTLHFRVAEGLHINSHTPGGGFLIPTTFSIPAGQGVSLKSAEYPPGTTMTLPADPGEKLNVYTGEFAIKARLSAAHGDRLVVGKLRYQACDVRQCMPPKTASVAIDVIGN